jgi:hypothetical protein
MLTGQSAVPQAIASEQEALKMGSAEGLPMWRCENEQDTSGSICRYIDGPLGTGCLLPKARGVKAA